MRVTQIVLFIGPFLFFDLAYAGGRPSSPPNDFIVSSQEMETGVARAYFYGSRTVIEFTNYPLYFSVEDSNGKPIPFQRVGKITRLAGNPEAFTASIDGRKVIFKAMSTEKQKSIGSVKTSTILHGNDFSHEVVGDVQASPVQINQRKSVTSLAPTTLTLQQALIKYVPKEYKVIVAFDVDQKMPIAYDTSLPWIESLDKSLSEIGFRMDANTSKKVVFIKTFKTTLAEIIDKHVPADYKVFTDAEIDLDTLIRYDASQYWIDALSKGAVDSGIDVTVNMIQKFAFLKPLINNNSAPSAP